LFLSRAAQAEPGKAEYQQFLGEAYWQTGSREQALGYFQRAAELEPSRRADYARALEGLGRIDQAMKQYEAIVAQNGGTAQVEESLGRLYVQAGNYAAAAPMLEKAAALTPTDPVLLQELAYALEKTNDGAKAVDVYRKVVALAPDAPISRSRLAESLFGQGKPDEAIAVLKEGISRTPQQPLLQRQFGSVLERSGNLTDAARAYRDYIQLAPNATDAQELASRADTLDAIAAQRSQVASANGPSNGPAPTAAGQP
jgi:predicted Zn-dependent protease